jgi:hypothetical protein
LRRGEAEGNAGLLRRPAFPARLVTRWLASGAGDNQRWVTKAI